MGWCKKERFSLFKEEVELFSMTLYLNIGYIKNVILMMLYAIIVIKRKIREGKA